MSFVDRNGKEKSPKKIGPTCKRTCFHQCTEFISVEEREIIHKSFWKLDSKRKYAFYSTYVKPTQIKRRRSSTINNILECKKKNSYNYYFKINNRTLHVCKKYFLNTLGITDRTIYYYFDKIAVCEKPKKKVGRKGISEEKLKEVMDHIKSFPTVESHYCRSTSTCKYLESTLNVPKMYSLYKIQAKEPVTLCQYRQIFNFRFNLSFHVPKKDLCDKCSLFKAKNGKHTEAEKDIFDKHLNEKRYTKAERDVDRQNIDMNTAIICYDLQNVFTLPKMYVSNFYYKRKLNVYNLTGTLIKSNKDKITYCAIWNESCCGRSGNVIASALIKILNKIVIDYPEIRKFILWSDSCVPQNKNKITSTALLQFLYNNTSIEQIVQKFCEPGHSSIQEVDCVHSTIERYLRNVEIPSQVTLIRLLINMKFENTTLKILQMNKNDFKNYSKKADTFCFQQIPFTKIKSLQYKKNNLFQICYKTSFEQTMYSEINLKAQKRHNFNMNRIFEQNLYTLPKTVVDSNKKKDLLTMIPYLSADEDKAFYNAILNINL